MPDIVIDGLQVTRFLSLETGNYMHLTGDIRARIEGLVADGIKFLQQSDLFREAHSADA
jgi:hypothetical protein